MAYSESESDVGCPGGVVDQNETRKERVVVLGTGWAGTSFLKDMDASKYDVQVVSPRNYFAFTPLLPSVTCGAVEARSIVEPIRNIIKKVAIWFAYTQYEHSEFGFSLMFCYWYNGISFLYIPEKRGSSIF